MRKVSKEMERKITYDRLFRDFSYSDLSTMYNVSKSGISLIIKRFCGKVYTDFIASNKNYEHICKKYHISKSSAKGILTEAERLYHVGSCYSKV